MGRGSAYVVTVQTLLLVLAYLLNDRAYGVIHTVGGASGWDLGVDYKSWAAGQTFKVGDVLFFPYLQSEHDVVVVSKAGYDGCSAANAIATYSAGNDNVTLTSAGAHYYLCSVVGHCAGGMRLAVTVAAAGAVPVSAPAPAPLSSAAPASTPLSGTAPAPSVPPASATAPISPAPSPTAPTRAPALAPAPAPISPAPAPAPVPASSAPAAPSSATPSPSSALTPSTSPIPGSPPAPSSPSSPPNAAPLPAAAFTPMPLIAALLLLVAL